MSNEEIKLLREQLRQKWITIGILFILLIVMVLFASYMYVNIEYLKFNPCDACKDIGYTCFKMIG